MQVRLRLKIVSQIVPGSAVVAHCSLSPSSIFAKVVLMKVHGNEERLFPARGFSFVSGRGCVEKCENGRAAACISLPIEAMQLAQKIHYAIVVRWNE